MLKVCAVYDSKAAAYMQPIFVPAVGLAIRMFLDECNRDDHKNPMYMHSADFNLSYLGEFDPDTGRFSGADISVLMTGVAARDVAV